MTILNLAYLLSSTSLQVHSTNHNKYLPLYKQISLRGFPFESNKLPYNARFSLSAKGKLGRGRNEGVIA